MNNFDKDSKLIATLTHSQLDEQIRLDLLKYKDPTIAVKIEIDSMAQHSHDLHLKPEEFSIGSNENKTFSGYCGNDVQFIFANSPKLNYMRLRQKQYGFQRTTPVPVIVGTELCTLPSNMLRFQRPFSDVLRLDSKIKAGIKLNIGYVFDPKRTNNLKKYYYIKS